MRGREVDSGGDWCVDAEAGRREAIAGEWDVECVGVGRRPPPPPILLEIDECE